MDEIKDRIKAIRKTLDLTQTEFGEKIGLGLGAIKNLEYGRTEPSPALSDLICKTFGVSVIWLEPGEGEMFRKMTRREKIANFVSEALADESDDFMSQLILVLAALSDDGWRKLREVIREFKKAEEKIRQDSE